MSRYKIEIQYDGTNYFGWQSQTNAVTIQGELEKSLLPLNNGKRIPIIGSGRTDTGVHALGQVAHFDIETKLDNNQLQKAINARLPNDIIILKIDKVPEDFHARFSAIKRYYNYQCYAGNNLLFNNQAWMLKKVEIGTLNNFAEKLIGKHDFQSYSKINKGIDNTICEIYQSEWIENDKMITFKICGNRFLHHMVRYLVGTMIAGSKGKISQNKFEELLNNPRKDVSIFIAPPQGLILMGIDYEIY